MEGVRPVPPSDGWDEQDIRLALLAGLGLRYLARDRDGRGESGWADLDRGLFSISVAAEPFVQVGGQGALCGQVVFQVQDAQRRGQGVALI